MRDRKVSRFLAAGVLAMLAARSPLFAEEDEKAPERPARYENPIVSLLFLPVTLLVKMASVFEPEKSRGSDRARPVDR